MKHVALMLREIHSLRKTGELGVREGAVHKLLVFQDGGLIFAKTDVPAEKLGQSLFRIGKISKEMVEALPEVIKPGVLLGEALVERRVISQHDLYDGLIAQMEEIALNAFSLFDPQLDFQPRPRFFDESFEFKLSLPLIIEDGVRRMPFHPSIKEFLSGKTFVFKSQSSVHLLTREEKKVLEALDGKRTTEGLQAHLGLADPEFWKAVYLFFCLNMAEERSAAGHAARPAAKEEPAAPGTHSKAPQPPSQPQSPPQSPSPAQSQPRPQPRYPPPPPPRPEVEATPASAVAAEAKSAPTPSGNVDEALSYMKIVADLDFYRVLGVTQRAEDEEIKKAYFRLARKFHPDLFGRAIDPKIRHQIEALFDLITKAYRTLSSKEARTVYDNKPAARAPEEDPTKKAETRFRQGKTLFNQARYEEAASLLEESVRLRAKPDYYLLLAMAEAKVPALSKKAEQAFLKAIEMEPWNPEGHLGLGLLYKAEGLMVKAKRSFEKALEADPDHAPARRELDAFDETGGKKGFKDILKMDLFGSKKK